MALLSLATQWWWLGMTLMSRSATRICIFYSHGVQVLVISCILLSYVSHVSKNVENIRLEVFVRRRFDILLPTRY